MTLDKYAEIISHPHYEPKHHPRMSRMMRAAQFAPYAALSGHAGAIRRTAKFAEMRDVRVIETNMDDERYDLLDDGTDGESELLDASDTVAG